MIGGRTEDTPARIRAVAVELFAEQGYEKTSLREIADRLGVTKAAIYYHYRSKQELLDSIVGPLAHDLAAMLDDAESTPHSPARTRLLLEEYLQIMLRHRRVCDLFVRDMASLAAVAPLWDQMMKLTVRLHELLTGPDAAPEDRVRAMAAVEVLGVALASSALLPDVSSDVVGETLLDCAGSVLGLRRPRAGVRLRSGPGPR